MKQLLLDQLTKTTLHPAEINKMIVEGKPKKILGFIKAAPESLDIFSQGQTNNIFHLLANKGVLSKILPTFLGSNADTILAREKATAEILKTFVNAVSDNGFTPAHLAVLKDPTALSSLVKSGAIVTTREYKTITESNKQANKSSPLQYVFRKEDSAHNFLQKSLLGGCTDNFELFPQEEYDVQRSLAEYYPYIIEEARKAITADGLAGASEKTKLEATNSKKAFAVIFQNFWGDILASESDRANFTKIIRLISVLNIVTNDEWKIELAEWASLLGDKNLKTIDDINKHILSKCSPHFLNGTLSEMDLKDLISLEEIDDVRLQKLKLFIEESLELKDENMDTGVAVLVGKHLNAAEQPAASVVEAVADTSNTALVAAATEDIQAAPPAAATAHRSSKPKAEIQKYASQVFKLFQKNTDCNTIFKEALGDEYLPLDAFIHASRAFGQGFFDIMLKEAAQELESNAMCMTEFLEKYTQSLIGAGSTVDIQAAPPAAATAHRSSKPKAEIQKYASQVSKSLQETADCNARLRQDLGNEYLPLHSFMDILLAFGEEFFNLVLKSAAKKLGSNAMVMSKFFEEYIQSLTDADLLATNHKNQLNAFDLACVMNNAPLAKLLLEKGFALGVYQEDTPSIFISAFKYANAANSTVIKYLLTEQNSVKLDWYHILSQALKYANVDAMNYYVAADCPVVNDVKDRKGHSAVDSKYSILNKALDNLVSVSGSVVSGVNLNQEQKAAAILKIPLLCDSIKIMIEADKIYYGLDNKLVGAKTLSLLRELGRNIKKISNAEVAEAAMNGLEELIIGKYKSFTLDAVTTREITSLENEFYSDNHSVGTDQSHVSALSDIGRVDQQPLAGNHDHPSDEA